MVDGADHHLADASALWHDREHVRLALDAEVDDDDARMSPLEEWKRQRPILLGMGRGDSRCARPLPFREGSRSLLLLRRCTLSHANNLRKRYGDYYENRKEDERREDHYLVYGSWSGLVMIGSTALIAQGSITRAHPDGLRPCICPRPLLMCF